MGKLIRTPQELLVAIEYQIKLMEKQVNAGVIGATIDWQSLDTAPYGDGFFNRETESILELNLPVKLLTEKGICNVDITVYLCAFTLLEGHHYYIKNPHYSRESPKKFMFAQDDYRHEVLNFVRDNLDFNHCFYVIQGSPKVVKQVNLQESFELNVHYMTSPAFTFKFPFIGATDKGLESLFMIYYGHWLHTKLLMQVIRHDMLLYKRQESKLLTPNKEGISPYAEFKAAMDKLYRSAFYTLQDSPNMPPRRYRLVYKYQGTDCYLFLSVYVSVCISVSTGKPLVIHHVEEFTEGQALQRVQAMEVMPFSQLLQAYYV